MTGTFWETLSSWLVGPSLFPSEAHSCAQRPPLQDVAPPTHSPAFPHPLILSVTCLSITEPSPDRACVHTGLLSTLQRQGIRRLSSLLLTSAHPAAGSQRTLKSQHKYLLNEID